MVQDEKEKKYIDTLIKLREDLKNLLRNKQELLEQIKAEIDILTLRIHDIDRYIGAQSFRTADQLVDTETFLDQTKNVQLDNVDFTRKIYSRYEKGVELGNFNYDGSNIRLTIYSPKRLRLKEESDIYLKKIINPLMAIKDKEPDLEIVVEKNQESNYIKRLLIKNVFHFESVEDLFKICNDLIMSLEELNSRV